MTTQNGAACCHTAAFALMLFATVAPVAAQQTAANPQARSLADYFTHGADATTIPQPGQPGYDFYSNGSQLFTVKPDSPYFQNGAQATSIQDSPYFQNGAQATSIQDSPYFQNGAEATTIPKDSPYFQNGAQATSVPAPGQPGYEYFAHGSELTSLHPAHPRAPAPAQPPANEEAQKPAAEEPANAEPAKAEASPEPAAPAPSAEQAAAPSGEPAPARHADDADDLSNVASGPEGTETSVTPATRPGAVVSERVAPPSPTAVQDADGDAPQGHYALDRVLDAYAVLLTLGAASLLLLLAAAATFFWRRRST